jgi:hypothetical protein
MDFEIVLDREKDGRWIAAIDSLPVCRRMERAQ